MRRMRNDLLTGRVALNQAEQLVIFASRSAFAFEATDERDKIYALLGLLSPRTLPPQLQPDYALTAEKIFLDYAVYLLGETKYLDILACSSGSRPGLPSWVPDWKVGSPCEYIHVGKVSHIRFLEENKKLEVECMVLSHVTKVLAPVEIPVDFEGSIHLEWESEDSAVMLSQSAEKIRGLARAIVMVHDVVLAIETKWFGCRALDANLTPAELDAWIDALQIGFREMAAIDTPQHHRHTARQLYVTLMNLTDSIIENGIDFITAMSEYCATLKFALRASMFQDSSGAYGRVRVHNVLPIPGDAICYLKGSSLRFVIRPEQDGWRLVGADWGRLPFGVAENQNVGTVEQFEAFWTSNRHKTQRIVLQ
ncbi:hypothetical protein C7999DRAFT_33079 [Corynascus novoguineensis]|uniref:Uncharacterized protein n=1 Tax=Corynascus novoguineensis TaxID=1126955 RepID=A0AAN7HMG6_9PEZI|nr:hypothetical protein C7999DRAFT_33079 [Corynascus novoguineensis]